MRKCRRMVGQVYNLNDTRRGFRSDAKCARADRTKRAITKITNNAVINAWRGGFIEKIDMTRRGGLLAYRDVSAAQRPAGGARATAPRCTYPAFTIITPPCPCYAP
ncbi:hypothetical protein EVAR_17243_1 [Eumeta japonica]|uniref:Uncharacterized protein n=1 Tax=Eumeta variegata TaxID=151549 RepID=A0A4C1TTH0_EUMVA|nr:hypothetical protein EVAR_17243_1 [Eumeta japonica]